MLHLWHYEWDEMIKLTSCVRADDRFMTLRVRHCDQFMTVWTKPSILLLHHNYPFIENISETKCIIYGSMSETRCPIYGTTSETRYFIHSDNESDQVLNIQQNEWYQMFHILTPYKATRIITKILSVTRYCMHDPFTTPWERDQAMNWLHYESYHKINVWHHEWYQLIHLWDHELDQIFHLLHLNLHHISYLLKPGVGSRELFETPWLKPDVLFIDTMSDTK